jgi:UPF0716 protein FxsA
LPAKPETIVWFWAGHSLSYQFSEWRTMVHPIRLASVLAFLAFPILEIGLLIRVGQSIGFLGLVAIVVASAMLGAAVIRQTGLAILTKARHEFETGTFGKSDPLVDGLLQVTAGMLLIFPGLMSDFIGIVLLVPIVRHEIAAKLMPRIFTAATFGGHETGFDPRERRRPANGETGPFGASGHRGKTIEGEYERVSEKTVKQNQVAEPIKHRQQQRWPGN